jgi:hypothetical protein
MKSFYNQFQDLATKYLNEYKVEYDNKLNNAIETKKAMVHRNYLDYLIRDKKIKIEGVLGQKFRIIHELEEEYGINSSLSKEDIFNQKIEVYPKNEHKKLIENLAKYDSIIKFYDFISKDSLYAINTIESNKLPTNITGIKWRGKTEIDFIHLVYALHTSGFLQNENKQVTNLVEELAKLFDFKLSKSWKQNHNSNINNTASDYKPRIFKELEESYIEYRKKK